MKNHFIESTTTTNEWNDCAIYTIGNYNHSESSSFYVGEAEIYSNRKFSYPLEVINEFGKRPGSTRVTQMIFRGNTVKNVLVEMYNDDRNPFNTINLKRFREIVERMYIDLLSIPPQFNKKRIHCTNYELSAALILHILSRKEKSIPKCLKWLSQNIDLLLDFDYKSKRFIMFDDTDSEDTVSIKTEINDLISDVLKLLEEGKYLQQGGYGCRDSDTIYCNTDIIVTLDQNTSGMTYVDQLWNAGIGDDCVSLYNIPSENRRILIIKPQDRGLSVDFRSWIDSKGISLDKRTLDEIEYELLLPSTL